MKLAGTMAVITGAGSGIGAATAVRFTRGGAKVVAVDVDLESAQENRRAVSWRRVRAPVRRRRPRRGERARRDELGPVDVLVNNAGVGLVGNFLDATAEDWDWLRGVNLDGVAYGCHAFGRAMVERGSGHVVNVASGAGYVPHQTLTAYCATKAAVIMLSQCLRADWASHGVGVSVICPGAINTPIASRARMVGPVASKRGAAERLLRRGRSPDVVADAIAGAVEHNRGIVPVGIESALAFRLLRFAPGPVQGALARAQVL